MTTGTLLVAGLGGAVLVVAVLGGRNLIGRLQALIATKAGRSPFEAKPVMNGPERNLYLRLVSVAPRGTCVLAQVQLSAFMQVRGLSDKQERWKYLNRIIRLSVDFLVADSRTMEPLLGIELDGASHRGRKAFSSGQLDADTRKNQAFSSAGIRLVRIAANNNPTADALKVLLSENLVHGPRH
jgi:very-short-patch-repair endonuclease